MNKILLQAGHEGVTTGATGANIDSYIAGIIDGEGWISIRKNKGKKTPKFEIVVGVSNTDKRLIDFLNNYCSGYTHSRNRHNGWKIENTWEINNKTAYDFLKKITPFLFLKRDRALICLEMSMSTSQKVTRDNLGRIKPTPTFIINKRLKLFNDLKLLNKRGVAHV